MCYTFNYNKSKKTCKLFTQGNDDLETVADAYTYAGYIYCDD